MIHVGGYCEYVVGVGGCSVHWGLQCKLNGFYQ